MSEVNLLAKLPRSQRNVSLRTTSKTADVIAISRLFGHEYFDGPREYGYGGYRYDGRWVPVARDIVAHFGLKAGDRVLDVGCAKGFLVKDLMQVCPGLEAFGLDISEYALMHCEPEVIGRLHLGAADRLLFPDNSFKAALSINTIHNYDRNGVIRCLKEMQRVSGGRAFVQVDSYHTEEQRNLFLDWVL
ncbi:MAG TPA: methyltransferase domain-containing protein, partial [Candidatus Binataceae bacterium]|nr:methyltransferase domain-containing protein [Candidatus Binataceae bacterium]